MRKGKASSIIRKLNIRRIMTLVILFSLACTLAACKKKSEPVEIRGRVYDPNTGIYVEGVQVVLSASRVQSGVYNSNYEIIGTAYSDASGGFSFSFEEQRAAGYRFTLTKEGYFSFETDVPTDDVQSGSAYSPTYNIYPEGFISLEIENTAPFDSADHITYSFTSGWLGCYECCDNSIRNGYGEHYHDTLNCRTYGNQNVTITWHVTKNNMTTLHNYSFYCSAQGINYYKISY